MYNLKRRTYDVQGRTYNIQGTTYDVRCTRYNIRHTKYDFQRRTYDVQYIMHNVSCSQSVYEEQGANGDMRDQSKGSIYCETKIDSQEQFIPIDTSIQAYSVDG